MCMIYKINNYRGDKELVTELKSAEAVKKFIVKQANKLNYGFYRWWTVDGDTYYDCGPITYKVTLHIE